jgi:integrase
LNKIIEVIGASRLSDIEPNKVERYLAGLLKAGKSHRTANQHRATAVSFAEWLYEQGRIASNPLKIVPTLNEAKDRRRVRRALTEDELARLIAVSDERQPYYLFAYYTGLRVKAVKAAVWGDVDFESSMIRVKAGKAKGKRDEIYLPLHPSLAAVLLRIKPPFASPTARIFPAVPTIRTFHRDCERAGIARYDAKGCQIDRHAFRTTLGTHLARAGVLPQSAMRVLGHSDVRITMKHYTALRIEDTAKAVQALPSIGPGRNAEALRATGTARSRNDSSCAALGAKSVAPCHRQ